MSGIAGIYNLDDQPVDRGLLERMTTAIAHRGPDGTGYWVDGAVGFGHQMLCTTPESLHERQPLRDAAGQLCLVMDGRVDNCAELRSALLARGARPRDDTDAELVLCAYQVWGEDCPKQIIGDFAFVIWDARKRQLFCARDFLGIKPFYYHFDGRTFRFGSELHQILRDETISREPNEGMVGEYLAIWIQNREETLYKSICRLPPAHRMIARSGQIRKDCYWTPEPSKELRYQTDQEYAEHFLELFKEAVRCRLRSHMPVGAYLSGGLDSSSIVGVCQALFRDEGLQVSNFETFSMLFPDQPECDESHYIQQVIDLHKIPANIVYPTPASPSWYSEQARRYLDFPDYPNGTTLNSVLQLAQSSGFRTLLTGCGGDEWFTGNQYYCADLIHQMKLPILFKEFKYRLKTTGFWSTLHHIFSYGFRPLLPPKLQRIATNPKHQDRALQWINEQFKTRTELQARIEKKAIIPLFGSYTRGEMSSILLDGSLAHGREVQERAASRHCIEERHPFNDQRVVRFAFSIPDEQLRQPYLTKFVIRNAMRDLIPENVRTRVDKAEFSGMFARTLQQIISTNSLKKLTIADAGWVDEDEVAQLCNQLDHFYRQADEKYIELIWPLWLTYGINLWHRTNCLTHPVKGSNERSPVCNLTSTA